MFQISHKLNSFRHINLITTRKNKQKMPVVNKPLVVYMPLLYKELEEKGNLASGLGRLLTGAALAGLGIKMRQKNKAETVEAQKTEVHTETRTDTTYQYSYEIEEDDDDYAEEYEPPSYHYERRKEPLVRRFFSACVDILNMPFEKFEDWRYQ